MLSFSRKTDYALIALAHLAGRAGVTSSAREIAVTYDLPVSLLMKILKALHHYGIVSSTRGVKGGYVLDYDLTQLSLYDLIVVLTYMDRGDADKESDRLLRETAKGTLPTEAPLLAVHMKMMRFLKDVKVADLVYPGQRIDVPLEMVSKKEDAVIQRVNASSLTIEVQPQPV